MNEIDKTQFRQAIGNFPTGVTVLTTECDGRLVGMTASSVTSLSLEPILLLACVKNTLPSHQAIQRRGRFAVNILAEGTEELALRFARPIPNKFEGVAFYISDGLPILESTVADFGCRLDAAYPGGDHSIFVGAVEQMTFKPERRPLLYWKSSFVRMEDHLASDPTAIALASWLS